MLQVSKQSGAIIIYLTISGTLSCVSVEVFHSSVSATPLRRVTGDMVVDPRLQNNSFEAKVRDDTLPTHS